MSEDGSPQAPAGWYPDPEVPGQQRYWDGTRWTDHTAAGPGSARGVGGGGSGSVAPSATSDWQGSGWQPAGGERPTTWLWQSIVATVFCCQPAGIVAIVFAAQAQGALNSGDLAQARNKAQTARTWTLVAVGLGLLIIVLVVLLMLGGAISSSDFA